MTKVHSNMWMGFPGGSDGMASACHAGDLGLIPGSGRSPGEGNGNPLQYSFHTVFLPGEFHGQRNLEGYSPYGGHKKSDMTEWLTLLQGVVILEFSLKGAVYLADAGVYTSNIVQKLKD